MQSPLLCFFSVEKAGRTFNLWLLKAFFASLVHKAIICTTDIFPKTVKITSPFFKQRQRKGIWNGISILGPVWSSNHRWPQIIGLTLVSLSLESESCWSKKEPYLHSNRDKIFEVLACLLLFSNYTVCMAQDWARSKPSAIRHTSSHSMSANKAYTNRWWWQRIWSRCYRRLVPHHHSYLQKPEEPTVTCCAITKLPAGRVPSVKTQNPHLQKSSYVSWQLRPFGSVS